MIAINVQEIYFSNGAGPSQALSEGLQMQGANSQPPMINSLQNNVENSYYRSNSISEHQKNSANVGKIQHGFIAVLKVKYLSLFAISLFVLSFSLSLPLILFLSLNLFKRKFKIFAGELWLH